MPSSASSATAWAPDGCRRLAPSPPSGTAIAQAPREGTTSWPLVDRFGYWLCWTVGIGLCLIALAIVLFMLVKGISYLRPSLLVHSPAPSQIQSQSGGFLDPIEGTLIVALIGTVIAVPVGVAIATWLSEYRRPAGLARLIESAIEITAGAPSVVLALFGLLIFAQGFLGLPLTTCRDGIRLWALVHRGGRGHGRSRTATDSQLHARGARPAAQPPARGLLRARPDTRYYDPPRAAAGDPP